MKTFLLTILSETDSDKVMTVLNQLADQKQIKLKPANEQPVSASVEQVAEMIDESGLGPFYSEADAKYILHL